MSLDRERDADHEEPGHDRVVVRTTDEREQYEWVHRAEHERLTRVAAHAPREQHHAVTNQGDGRHFE